MSSRLLGLGLAILGVLLLSPDAALTRLFDGASWTLIFGEHSGRSLFWGLIPHLVPRWITRLFSWSKSVGMVDANHG